MDGHEQDLGLAEGCRVRQSGQRRRGGHLAGLEIQVDRDAMARLNERQTAPTLSTSCSSRCRDAGRNAWMYARYISDSSTRLKIQSRHG